MPRLQILHHKSYHPYNEKNKQRVREDEAKARAEELAREQKIIDAEATERLNLLRRRAGSPEASPSAPRRGEDEVHGQGSEKERARERRQRERLDFDFPSETKKRNDRRDAARDREGGSERQPVDERERERERERLDDRSLEDRFQSGGHVNFWADFESGRGDKAPAPLPTAAELAKRKAEQEADQFTMYLSRPERETKPWYTDREFKRVEDTEAGDEAEFRRARDRRGDVRAKDRNDPLTDINKRLAASKRPTNASRPMRLPRAGSSGGQSERERALALLAKKSGASSTQRRGWETPDGGSWHDELERQKDMAGNRYHADTWDRSRSGRR